MLLLGAVAAAAIGYAEGGLLARELGAWQTISWALVLAFPVMGALTLASVYQQPPAGTPVQWAAFAYLGVISMFLGFFAWYRGLGLGPMAQISQIQLAQPVLSILWAGLLLGEHLTPTTIVGGLAVILCAGAAVRVRLNPAPRTSPRAVDLPGTECSRDFTGATPIFPTTRMRDHWRFSAQAQRSTGTGSGRSERR